MCNCTTLESFERHCPFCYAPNPDYVKPVIAPETPPRACTVCGAGGREADECEDVRCNVVVVEG